MERLTRFDRLSGCYKVNGDISGRSVIQELGIYEDIHEKEVEKATNIGDIRDAYIKKGVKLDPYWENFGRKEE